MLFCLAIHLSLCNTIVACLLLFTCCCGCDVPSLRSFLAIFLIYDHQFSIAFLIIFISFSSILHYASSLCFFVMLLHYASSLCVFVMLLHHCPVILYVTFCCRHAVLIYILDFLHLSNIIFNYALLQYSLFSFILTMK
ncbi:MAG: hypothetical protein ACI90V_006138 [Bacillariaceae sp.]|jgi:hypothetical protein